MDLDDQEYWYSKFKKGHIRKEIVQKDYIKKDEVRKILEKYEKKPIEDGPYLYKEIKELVGD